MTTQAVLHNTLVEIPDDDDVRLKWRNTTPDNDELNCASAKCD